MREGLWEDIEHDPSFRKQRLVGQYGLAVLVGLITFDDLHHAPACPANRWSGKVIPEGPCSCGATQELKYPVMQK